MNLVDPEGEASKAYVTVYKYSRKLYKIYRVQGKITANSLKKAELSEFVDIAGDLNTIFSRDTSFGNKVGAVVDLLIGTEFNNKGKVEIAKTLGILKTHKHHLIPKAIYNKYADKLKNVIKRDSKNNLIEIPEGFHGNHPQYGKWVENKIKNLKREIKAEDIEEIMNEAQEHINEAYKEYLINGKNLNEYFRAINNNK